MPQTLNRPDHAVASTSPPAVIELEPLAGGDPRLWYVDLDAVPEAWARARVGDEELGRASRFATRSLSHRFLAAHAVLRQVLARLIGTSCVAVPLVADEDGKPRLAGSGLPRFNLSHSAGHGLIAVDMEREVGCDIEQLRPIDDAFALALAYYTPGERRALARRQSAHGQSGAGRADDGFLTCWTRKEACLKAIGCGLSLPPQSIEVGVEPVARALELQWRGEDWSLRLSPVTVAGRAVRASVARAERAGAGRAGAAECAGAGSGRAQR